MLREPNLTLQKAIDMCCNSEIANAQWKTMNSDQNMSAVNYTRRESKFKGEPNLTLQKAIDMCRNSEIANAQWKTMNSEQNMSGVN